MSFTIVNSVEAGAATVAYRKQGEGPAIVFVPGFPLSGFTWRKVVAGLSDRFTCYAFDLVGLGETTSGSTEDYSSPGQGRVLQQALSALGVRSFALVGNDTGGWVARELALLEQDRVTHLALTNTEMPGHRPPWVPMYQRLVRLAGSKFLIRWLLASRRLRKSPIAFGGCFADRRLIDGEFAKAFIAPLLSSDERVKGMFEFLRQMRFERIDAFRELHGKLAMPVSFLWGEDDPTFPIDEARAMAKQFRNVTEFRTLPGAKLFVQEEFPDAVVEWLGGFVGAGG